MAKIHKDIGDSERHPPKGFEGGVPGTVLKRGASSTVPVYATVDENELTGNIGAEKFQSGTDERDWVAARYGEAGEATSTIDTPIGIILMLRYDGNSSRSVGDTTDGSNLVYSNGDGGSGSPAGPDSGTTWRCLGFAFRDGVPPGDTNPGLRTTIFMRTS